MRKLQYRQAVWWGGQAFAPGQGRTWEMAGLQLEVSRQPQEWHFRLRRTREQSEDNHHWQVREGLGLAECHDADFCRFVFRQTTPPLQLLPRLADRSVVVRPITPLFLPAGQETTFYFSTPVWLAAYAEGIAEPLMDVPVVIPRDTWFGPSPVRGQLCYASQVTGRTDPSQQPPRPFRATTPVLVRNHGHTAMPVERINIPAPFLPVYGAESGRLWTPTLSITRPATSAQLQIQIEAGISTLAGHVELLTAARRGSDEHALIRVFDTFFD